MRSASRRWNEESGWGTEQIVSNASLLFLFGDRHLLEDGSRYESLRQLHPDVAIVGCSTAGEIDGETLTNVGLNACALRFESSRCQVSFLDLGEMDSQQAGAQLAASLPAEGLKHVIVFSDGSFTNGTQLCRGMSTALPEGVAITGGLAGDAERFEKTLVMSPTGPREHHLAAIGLYGEDLQVAYGSLGGWDPFGPMRTITKSEGNELFELDGEPALALYKKYLGHHADKLPSSALLFPLLLRAGSTELVRTILGVDEERQSMTFAGDVPTGSSTRLMKANFERIVEGAAGAARVAMQSLAGQTEFALLVSCVGRRLILKQRAEEELEAVREVLGAQATMTGFYSYGELCPGSQSQNCDLHNQTMTITALREGTKA